MLKNFLRNSDVVFFCTTRSTSRRQAWQRHLACSNQSQDYLHGFIHQNNNFSNTAGCRPMILMQSQMISQISGDDTYNRSSRHVAFQGYSRFLSTIYYPVALSLPKYSQYLCSRYPKLNAKFRVCFSSNSISLEMMLNSISFRRTASLGLPPL